MRIDESEDLTMNVERCLVAVVPGLREVPVHNSVYMTVEGDAKTRSPLRFKPLLNKIAVLEYQMYDPAIAHTISVTAGD